MADSIRQQIVDAVEEQFQTITTANDYETNLGSNVFLWRDLVASPALPAELPLCNLADWKETTATKFSGRGPLHNTLFWHVECLCTKTADDSADKVGRKILADVIKALGTAYANQVWFGGLVMSLLPVEANEGTNIFDFEQKDKSIFSVKYQFKTEYRIGWFDPYTGVR
jgi:hypothetical protein